MSLLLGQKVPGILGMDELKREDLLKRVSELWHAGDPLKYSRTLTLEKWSAPLR